MYYSHCCNKYQRVEDHCRGSQFGDSSGGSAVRDGSWRGSRLDSKADVDVAFEDDIAVADVVVAFEDHDYVVGDDRLKATA